MLETIKFNRIQDLRNKFESESSVFRTEDQKKEEKILNSVVSGVSTSIRSRALMNSIYSRNTQINHGSRNHMSISDNVDYQSFIYDKKGNKIFYNKDVLDNNDEPDSQSDSETCLFERKFIESYANLVDTERVYVETLDVLVNFFTPLLQKEKHLVGIPCPEYVLSNISVLHSFHRNHLYPKIQRISDISELADVFIHEQNSFKVYSIFLRGNNSRSRKVREIDMFFNENGKLKNIASLESHLWQPVARLSYYSGFLNRTLQICFKYNESHGRTNPIKEIHIRRLQKALKIIQGIADFTYKYVLLTEIAQCKVNLSEQGSLLLEDFFFVTGKSLRHERLKCFLFENCLILAKISGKKKEEEYIYHLHYSIENIGVLPPMDRSSSTFKLFNQEIDNDLIQLTSNSKNQQIWVSCIRNLITKQAEGLKRN